MEKRKPDPIHRAALISLLLLAAYVALLAAVVFASGASTVPPGP